MYVKRNTVKRSRNNCCSGKAITSTYSKCLSLALGIQHAMGMRHTVISDLPGLYNTFPHYLINGTIFGEKSH
jgi:hypothetical protein